jgi:AcrR family transcriptional regulator
MNPQPREPDPPEDPDRRPPPPRRTTKTCREAIISSAASCFYAHGYADTTLAQVADQLGVTDKALYYYFRNKDALYLETILACLAWAQALIDSAASQGGSGLDKVRRFVTLAVEGDGRREPFLTLVPAHLRETPLGLRILEKQACQQDILVGWVREGIADGSIAEGDPIVLWRCIEGALIWIDTWAPDHPGCEGGPARMAANMVDRFLSVRT